MGIRRSKHIIQLTTAGVHESNPIHIKTEHNFDLTGSKRSMSLVLTNVRSIKPRELDLYQQLNETNTDLCIVTETCLKNNPDDEAWTICSVLNTNEYKVMCANRTVRQRGGLMPVFKSTIQFKSLEQDELVSFQYTMWSARVTDRTVHILAVYHPPYSPMNPITNHQFIDEFTTWLPDKLTKYSNIIIVGNFNIHIDDTDCDEGTILKDTIDAFGLIQHVRTPTHKDGHTLDLIMTE